MAGPHFETGGGWWGGSQVGIIIIHLDQLVDEDDEKLDGDEDDEDLDDHEDEDEEDIDDCWGGWSYLIDVTYVIGGKKSDMW